MIIEDVLPANSMY